MEPEEKKSVWTPEEPVNRWYARVNSGFERLGGEKFKILHFDLCFTPTPPQNNKNISKNNKYVLTFNLSGGIVVSTQMAGNTNYGGK